MANSEASAKLQKQIDRLRSLPTELVKRAAPDIAKEGLAQVTANVASQVGPDGTPWPASKSGKPVLVQAASHVTVQALGTVILFKLTGIDARHHKGFVKGGERRPIIPVRSMPQPLAAAIKKVLKKRFLEVMAGT